MPTVWASRLNGSLIMQSKGECWGKAVTYLRQAGAKALARSSNREALAYFEQALTALTFLSETREIARAGHRCPLRPSKRALSLG